MSLHDRPDSWGAVAKLLHWVAAVLILALLGLGLSMVHAQMSSGAKFGTYQLHKSTGFLVLAVTLMRGVWRAANFAPSPPEGMKLWEWLFARSLHLALYVFVLAMIASGWLMVSASPLPIPTRLPFGFAVPNLTGPNPLIEARAKFTHEVLSKLVIAAIALHVTGALKHHFIDRDGVLSRMLPFVSRDRAAPDWK
jgi:cytochrome b561